MARIQYTDDDGELRDVYVGPDRPEIVIGRVKSCDLVTTNRTVSRIHASIRYQDGHCVLRDQGSANGTYFRKQPVSEVVLEPGEPVYLGSFAVTLIVDDEPASAPEPAPAPAPAPAPEPAPAPVPTPGTPSIDMATAAVNDIRPSGQPAPFVERRVPKAWKADWKPGAPSSVPGQVPVELRQSTERAAGLPRPAPAGTAAAGGEIPIHPLKVEELEVLLENERRENERLSERLYDVEAELVDLRSSMAMISDENRSMAVTLDKLDLESADHLRELEDARGDRDRFRLEASSLKSEVEALRRMPSGTAAELEAALREIQDLKLSNRGYLKRIGKLLEEKEKQMPGGSGMPDGVAALMDGLNETAVASLAALDAIRAGIAELGDQADSETAAELRMMVSESIKGVSSLKKDLQELVHRLNDTFNM